MLCELKELCLNLSSEQINNNVCLFGSSKKGASTYLSEFWDYHSLCKVYQNQAGFPWNIKRGCNQLADLSPGKSWRGMPLERTPSTPNMWYYRRCGTVVPYIMGRLRVPTPQWRIFFQEMTGLFFCRILNGHSWVFITNPLTKAGNFCRWWREWRE